MTGFGASAAMTANYFAGNNLPVIFSNDAVTEQLRKSPGVAYARNLYYSKIITKGYVPFGAKGYYNSGMNPIAQFVGGFSYEISVDGNNLDFNIKNVTSLHSLLLDLPPNSWNTITGPGSNMTQYYMFSEPIRK